LPQLPLVVVVRATLVAHISTTAAAFLFLLDALEPVVLVVP
jgi:hypothetical protein